MPTNWIAASAPVTRRVRAYFAPVNRAAQLPVLFDASQQGAFDLDAPPSPWIDLGWIQGFTRKTTSKSSAVMAGIPAAPLEQVRTSLEAQVSFEFLSWSKLTMALATGSQHMNLLASGTVAATVQSGSTATAVMLAAGDAAKFAAGTWVAIDADYAGQTGYVGSPVAGAYVRQPLSDPDIIRRVTFNVGLVSGASATGLTLAQPLPGGAPGTGAKVQAVTGFVDREGGSFYQEWSALFAIEGSQGERILFHYPRLQSMAGAAESANALDGKRDGGLERVLLKGEFLALPVADPLDGERVLCYRSYLPAPNSLI